MPAPLFQERATLAPLQITADCTARLSLALPPVEGHAFASASNQCLSQQTSRFPSLVSRHARPPLQEGLCPHPSFTGIGSVAC